VMPESCGRCGEPLPCLCPGSAVLHVGGPFEHKTEHALRAARRAHAMAVEQSHWPEVASRAREVWQHLRQQPRYAWLNRPPGG
jgi:hypothetical protein